MLLPVRAGTFFFLLLLLVMPIRVAEGQSLVQRYREALFESQAEEIFRRHGMRAKPRPPAHVPSAADTLAAWWGRHDEVVLPPPAPPPFPNLRLRSIRRLERGWFERTFGSTQWSFSGNISHTRIDTTRTPEIRARLEDRFGAPTRTVAEAFSDSGMSAGEYIQFEYWVVANDSIPLRIMDTGGPLDRGVILVAPSAMRGSLPALRAALERELFEAATKAAYVDYYFDALTRRWYETGYEGGRYITKEIARPRAGVRPPLPD